MSAAAVVALAVRHGVRLSLSESGVLRVSADTEPPPDLLAELRAHRDAVRDYLAVQAYVERACAGVPGIRPAQYVELLSDDDRQWIAAGRYELPELHAFARSFSAGIASGRIVFDGDTLIEHGLVGDDVLPPAGREDAA